MLSALFCASLVAQVVKNLPAVQETEVQSLGQEDPLKKEWQPTGVFLPGESHRQRSLAGYSTWDHKILFFMQIFHYETMSLYIIEDSTQALTGKVC